MTNEHEPTIETRAKGDVIINCWQTLTGKEAVLESTGEAFNAMVA